MPCQCCVCKWRLYKMLFIRYQPAIYQVIHVCKSGKFVGHGQDFQNGRKWIITLQKYILSIWWNPGYKWALLHVNVYKCTHNTCCNWELKWINLYNSLIVIILIIYICTVSFVHAATTLRHTYLPINGSVIKIIIGCIYKLEKSKDCHKFKRCTL